MRNTARELVLRLGDVEAQGVPYTAAIDATGLVSWGRDPEALLTAGFPGGCSWRMFIVNRLAMALKRAPLEHNDALVEFALQRIRLEGIEPDEWLPAAE
jgi:hypothetical protein